MKTRFFATSLISPAKERHGVLHPKHIMKKALLVITGLALLATANAKAEGVDARAKISDALLDFSEGQTQLVQKYDADGKKIEMPAKPQTTQPSPDLITSGTYGFTASTGAALEDMSSGTTTLVGNNLDDTASGLTLLPFDFWFDGVRANQFSVNANGEMRLGNTVIGTTFTNCARFHHGCSEAGALLGRSLGRFQRQNSLQNRRHCAEPQTGRGMAEHAGPARRQRQHRWRDFPGVDL